MLASGRTRFSMRLSTDEKPTVGALGMERLGDPPGDRVVVGDAEDERRSCRRAVPSVPPSDTVSVHAYHRRMTPTDASRGAPRGRGLVLDADGVIVLAGEALPGAPEAVAGARASAASRSAS